MSNLSRREFVQAGSAGMLMAGAGLDLLAACTTASGPQSAAPVSAAVLPRYIPLKGIKPDLAASENGVEAGYFAYPANPLRSVTRPPGRGGEMTTLTPTYNALAPSLDRNTAWQELNRQLGLTLKASIVGINDYQVKLNTVIAGGDLPDVMYFGFGGTLTTHFLEFLRSSCTDLTSYLAGSAIQDYPNLANIPTFSWRYNGVWAGRLYAVPLYRPPLGSALFVRRDLLESVGVTQPKNADEFTRLMKELTRPNHDQYGIVTQSGFSGFWGTMFRTPNGWRLDSGGKLVSYIETEEHKASVGYTRNLYAAGVFHPKSGPALGITELKDLFISGKAAVTWDGFAAWTGYWDSLAQVSPSGRVEVMVPFGHDGGKGVYHRGNGANNLTVMLKKNPPDRVREVLRVLNFMAAPFGTQEHLLINYGVKDVDYTLNAAGNPTLTATGRSEMTMPWRYLASPNSALFDPTSADFVRVAHAQEEQLLAIGVDNPTWGLYSPTSVAKGAVLSQEITDRTNDIVAGRAPFSDYDAIVRDWRAHGGEQIRKEYQKALEQASK